MDTDTWQRFPKTVNAGNVTVTGVADSKGAKSLHLKNLSNSYQIPDGTTLGYYDAHFQRSIKGRGSIFVLKLLSPVAEPPKVTRYCRFPRDIEDPSLRRVPGEARRH